MKIVKCRSCMDPIVFLRTVNNKPMPVNADTVGKDDTTFNPKMGHVSHYATCKWAAQHRKKAKLPSRGEAIR